MIGSRVGLRVGPRVGVASGVAEDPVGSLSAGGGGGGGGGAAETPIGSLIPGVTADATSGFHCPANTAEWQLVYTAAGISPALTPGGLWLMQEASGNLADSTATFTLTASGTGLAYQQAVTGWTRKAVTTTEGGTGVFTNADGGLNDVGVGNIAMLGYVKTTTSVTRRSILGLGLSATRCAAERAATSGFGSMVCGANSQDGAADPSSSVRPWLVQMSRSQTLAPLYTNTEKVIPAFGATASGRQVTFGALALSSSACSYLYGAVFLGNPGNLTEAQWRALLTALRWNVAW